MFVGIQPIFVGKPGCLIPLQLLYSPLCLKGTATHLTIFFLYFFSKMSTQIIFIFMALKFFLTFTVPPQGRDKI